MCCFDPVAYINSKLVFGSKPGLERISALLHKLGSPQEKLRCIHIAGTNGKGSTANYLMNIYQKAGYRTGLYISPYVSHFEERISINGKYISREELTEVTLKVRPLCEEMEESPTEFELITAIAFLYFLEQKCDIVILETGLGGRFDATNVISSPLLSVITSISFDHMQYLGDTLDKIAFEKCGIIKIGHPTVCYPLQETPAMDMIRSQAANKNSRLILPDLGELKVNNIALGGTDICYRDMNLHIPLPGKHQIYNCITAVEAVLHCEGFTVNAKDIMSGVAATTFPARFEVIEKDPLIIIEGAHNSDGIDSLLKNIDAILKGVPLIVVMGMLMDKGYVQAVSKIAPLCRTFIGITPENPRAASSELVCREAVRYCDDVINAGTAEKAAKAALDAYIPGAAVLVCGSLYIAGSMKQELLKELECRKQSI